MKDYGAMRVVAGVLKLFGWITIVIGGLFFVLFIVADHNVPSSPYVNHGMVVFIAFVIAGLVVLLSIFTVAAGELIAAIADIATNSAQLAKISENTEKTVNFFERVASRVAARSPAA